MARLPSVQFLDVYGRRDEYPVPGFSQLVEVDEMAVYQVVDWAVADCNSRRDLSN